RCRHGVRGPQSRTVCQRPWPQSMLESILEGLHGGSLRATPSRLVLVTSSPCIHAKPGSQTRQNHPPEHIQPTQESFRLEPGGPSALCSVQHLVLQRSWFPRRAAMGGTIREGFLGHQWQKHRYSATFSSS